MMRLMCNQLAMNCCADTMGCSCGTPSMGSLSPQEADLKNSLSSQNLVLVLSNNFNKTPTMSPATSATPTEIPTQTRLHPATSLLLMKQVVLGVFEGQRVGRSTSQLQYVLRTIGATAKVPRKATIHILTIPKESVILLLLSEGYNFSQKSAEMSPAINPTAIAAPIFLLVPATDPHMMAPVMVPSSEARIPIFPLGLKSTEKAQVKMTDALSAMKMEMKASCQRYSLAKSVLTKVYLAVNMVVVAQKARKRKKVPMWARIDELAVLLKSEVSAVGGDLTKQLMMMPQVAAKRQTLLIWQSSKKRRSGEFCTRRTFKKWFKFQAKLNSRLWKTSCVVFSLPKTPKITTSWAMALASAILKLQQSRQTQSPPKLYWYMRVGSEVVRVVPLKFVMKTLNQNFWKMGESMTVAETMEMLVAMAITVALLKQARSSPNPMTTKIASTTKSPPSRVCTLGVVVSPVVGQFCVVAFLISPAKPQIQYTPKSARRMMPPVALLDLQLPCLASLGWTCEECMGSALWFTVAISGFNYCLKLQKLLDLFKAFKRKLTHRIGGKDRRRI